MVTRGLNKIKMVTIAWLVTRPKPLDLELSMVKLLNVRAVVKKFDINKVTKEDVEQYYHLYGQLGVKKGNLKRAREIHKSFPSIDREHFIKGGTGLAAKPHGATTNPQHG